MIYKKIIEDLFADEGAEKVFLLAYGLMASTEDDAKEKMIYLEKALLENRSLIADKSKKADVQRIIEMLQKEIEGRDCGVQ